MIKEGDNRTIKIFDIDRRHKNIMKGFMNIVDFEKLITIDTFHSRDNLQKFIYSLKKKKQFNLKLWEIQCTKYQDLNSISD